MTVSSQTFQNLKVINMTWTYEYHYVYLDYSRKVKKKNAEKEWGIENMTSVDYWKDKSNKLFL